MEKEGALVAVRLQGESGEQVLPSIAGSVRILVFLLGAAGMLSAWQ